MESQASGLLKVKMHDYYKIQSEFISKDQEFEIIKFIGQGNQTGSGRNRILRYGNRKPYSSDMVSHLIPECFIQMNLPIEYDSLAINEYYPGQLLDWRIDKPEAGKEIKVLNLVNDCALYFRKGKEILGINLKPLDLITFGGDLRYNWQHMVRPERYRISIVFRNSKDI